MHDARALRTCTGRENARGDRGTGPKYSCCHHQCWDSGAMGNVKSNFQDEAPHSSKTPKHSREAQRCPEREPENGTPLSSTARQSPKLRTKTFRSFHSGAEAGPKILWQQNQRGKGFRLGGLLCTESLAASLGSALACAA